MAAEEIPSKGIKLPQVFHRALACSEGEAARGEEERASRLCVLEVGCGTGELSAWLHERGHVVTGVDVNSDAIAAAARRCPQGSFAVADTTHEAFPGQVAQISSLPDGDGVDGLFDFAVLQLLLSILGGIDARTAVLANVLAVLKPGGRLYLACSGESGAVNAKYAELYAQDREATGERNTYFSRDSAGQYLYTTHHFEVEELQDLLHATGFADISIEQVQEASSRRPGEAANFLYVTASRPTGKV